MNDVNDNWSISTSGLPAYGKRGAYGKCGAYVKTEEASRGGFLY